MTQPAGERAACPGRSVGRRCRVNMRRRRYRPACAGAEVQREQSQLSLRRRAPDIPSVNATESELQPAIRSLPARPSYPCGSPAHASRRLPLRLGLFAAASSLLTGDKHQHFLLPAVAQPFRPIVGVAPAVTVLLLLKRACIKPTGANQLRFAYWSWTSFLLLRHRALGSVHEQQHLFHSELAILVGVHSFEYSFVSDLKFR